MDIVGIPPEKEPPAGPHTFLDIMPDSTGSTQNIQPVEADATPSRPAVKLSLLLNAVPSEEAIADQGKADAFTKAIALVQTVWFVAQCIARRAEALPITHLEIVTAAYTVVNVALYFFWWDKPLSATVPTRVYDIARLHDPGEGNPGPNWFHYPIINTLCFCGYLPGMASSRNIPESQRIPAFYAGDHATQLLRIFLPSIVGSLAITACFGAIHCGAWNFTFPTHDELQLWRYFSIVITGLPVLGAAVSLTALWIDFKWLHLCNCVVSVLYILARVVLLVLAFMSLRDLPAGAFVTVPWTSFVPHV